jgi:hypothetical protein
MTPLDVVVVNLGPSVSVSEPSPSSPQMLGNAHIFGFSPNLQVSPRLVVVNPTPNLTPHPTPASPVFTFASLALTSISNNHNGLGTRKEFGYSVTTAVTATDINFVSSSSISLP